MTSLAFNVANQPTDRQSCFPSDRNALAYRLSDGPDRQFSFFQRTPLQRFPPVYLRALQLGLLPVIDVNQHRVLRLEGL